LLQELPSQVQEKEGYSYFFLVRFLWCMNWFFFLHFYPSNTHISIPHILMLHVWDLSCDWAFEPFYDAWIDFFHSILLTPSLQFLIFDFACLGSCMKFSLSISNCFVLLCFLIFFSRKLWWIIAGIFWTIVVIGVMGWCC
jgi:hypothetical protein